MHKSFVLHLILLTGLATASAQGPFEFREAFLLSSRMQADAISQYDPNHSEQVMSSISSSPLYPQWRDLRNTPDTYQGADWKNVVSETDQYRRMGGLELAEKQYVDIVENLRQAQGLSSSHLALMLDHLAEFYLEERNFDKAYKTFTEAVAVRRLSIDALIKGPPMARPGSQVPGAVMNLRDSRIHLSDLLTRLGQLDMAKGDLISASSKLAEAVAIVNLPENIRYTDGLNAIYFQSIVFEKQSKWKEAEDLWQATVKLRESIGTTAVYWDAQKEMAAFYARRGDFHSAAAIARKIASGTVGMRLLNPGHFEFLENRPRYRQSQRYEIESDVALSEILAIDAWQTTGPDAAAALLKNPVDNYMGYKLDGGSDAERTSLLAWFQKRVFLHMSMLLGGTPSQAHIDAAYTALSSIKGRYLASLRDVTRFYESERGNPGVQIPEFATLDQLAAAREKQSHLFLASALDGKQLNELEFAKNDNTERILSTAIVSSSEASSARTIFSLQSLMESVAADTAFIDIVAWQRSSRDGKTPPLSEYGAFLVRKGQPIRYFRLGDVKSIDTDVDTLHRLIVANQPSKIAKQITTVAPQSVPQFLKHLYGKVFAPMQGAFEGATKLFIVPDGKLMLAPMSAFLDDNGHYVFEANTITYLGSWRDMVSTVGFGSLKPTPPLIVGNPEFNLSLYGPQPASGAATSTHDRSKAIVFRSGTVAGANRPLFNQLPGAATEAVEVAKELNVPQDRVLTGDAARKSLVQSIQNPALLHFATHSVPNLNWKAPAAKYTMFEFPEPLDTQYPLLQSIIALAGANRPEDGPEDGLLTGLEITSLHLQGTRLVVLSSCESGQGTLLDGQGVLGLRAAFSVAGGRGDGYDSLARG